MNTRLKVEHPVTEMLTGLDLVEWQLRVARGEPLPLMQEQVRLSGHAIEVRLCAEDEHFTPHAGTVQRFAEPPLPEGLRFDHALEDGGVVTPHYDAMLGKLIAHAPNRREAIARLAHALDDTVLLGLPSNRAFLSACLRHPVFAEGGASIPFLADHGQSIREALDPPHEAKLAAALAAVWLGRGATALPSPFARPLRVKLGQTTLDLSVRELGHGALQVEAGKRTHAAHIGANTIAVDGLAQAAEVVRQADGQCHVRWGAHDLWLQDLSLKAALSAGQGPAARELRAPFNGKLVSLSVQPGQRVARGQVLLTIESMKIEHQISAPRDATVSGVTVVAGQQLMPGQVLAVFAEEAA
jgi:geranyl-CoA carboxylase alpha subunit